MKKFKSYILNEEQSHLGHKVGDVLTAAQDLQGDMENMGQRHLIRLAEQIVNQIRKILHSQWSLKNHAHLKELQKVAVAIQKTIDDKGDLKELLPAAVQTLQDLSGKLGVKVNDLEAPEAEGGEEVSQDDFALTGNGPSKPSAQDMQGQQMPQMPQQGAPPMPNQGMPPQGTPPMPQGPMPPMG